MTPTTSASAARTNTERASSTPDQRRQLESLAHHGEHEERHQPWGYQRGGLAGGDQGPRHQHGAGSGGLHGEVERPLDPRERGIDPDEHGGPGRHGERSRCQRCAGDERDATGSRQQRRDVSPGSPQRDRAFQRDERAEEAEGHQDPVGAGQPRGRVRHRRPDQDERAGEARDQRGPPSASSARRAGRGSPRHRHRTAAGRPRQRVRERRQARPEVSPITARLPGTGRGRGRRAT